MTQRKAAVLVHGRHTESQDWQEIMWGIPPYKLGVLTQAILVAMEKEANVMYFCDGVPTKDKRNGSEYMRDMLFKHLPSLSAFEVFASLRDAEIDEDDGLNNIKRFLERILQIRGRATNTLEEIEVAALCCYDDEITDLTIVTCETHLPRVTRDALLVFGQRIFSGLRTSLSFQAGMVPYAETRMDQVTVIEPPHFPKRCGSDFSAQVQRISRLPAEKAPGFFEELDALLKRYGS